eukprot:365806-Chlamydomonas_euryale.AAC.1
MRSRQSVGVCRRCAPTPCGLAKVWECAVGVRSLVPAQGATGMGASMLRACVDTTRTDDVHTCLHRRRPYLHVQDISVPACLEDGRRSHIHTFTQK